LPYQKLGISLIKYAVTSLIGVWQGFFVFFFKKYLPETTIIR
jgi:hypothetical protein